MNEIKAKLIQYEVDMFRHARKRFEEAMRKNNLLDKEIKAVMDACYNLCNKIENYIRTQTKNAKG